MGSPAGQSCEQVRSRGVCADGRGGSRASRARDDVDVVFSKQSIEAR